jgi:hypothetical protein
LQGTQEAWLSWLYIGYVSRHYHDIITMQLVERIPGGPFASELRIMVLGVNIVVIKPLLYFLSHRIRNKIIDDQVS